ncbi:hypothetical protein HYU50_00995 [Candidatus Woesearchaeota archaeon]|nr:hypothetical protein [Candidatus Woesearchaeota archaeon]
MVVLNFRRRGNVSPIADYVQVSPVDRDVAAALIELANDSIGNHYWVERRTLDNKLVHLGKEGLETTLHKKGGIFGMIPPGFREKLARSIIYNYDAQKGLVRVTPTPFGTGEQVGKYFAIRSPEYAGR